MLWWNLRQHERHVELLEKNKEGSLTPEVEHEENWIQLRELFPFWSKVQFSPLSLYKK
jgi:hypothetical protein